MEHASNSPQAALPSTTIRHDGWTGDKMAIFCETLAETAVVAEACDKARMGISGAYALRRRSPVFAAAWDAALTIARERLADTLLARSIEGNVEQIYRDGVCVGERHVIDNRLGLAILRRLDRLAETGCTVSAIGQRAVTLNRHPAAPATCHLRPIDWELAIDALRTGDEGSLAKALAMFEGNEVEEVEDPPVSLIEGDSEAGEEPEHCWWDEEEERWMTSFPPPGCFTAYQKGEWGSWGYERDCTPEEIALLEASDAAALAAEHARAEAARDSWFEELRAELSAEGKEM